MKKRSKAEVLQLFSRLNMAKKKRTKKEMLKLISSLNVSKRKLVKFSINLDSSKPFIKTVK